MGEQYKLDFKLRALAALDANDGNLYQTAARFGIHRGTLREWDQQRDLLWHRYDEQREQREETITARMELLIARVIDMIPDEMGQARLIDIARTLTLMRDLQKEVQAEARRNEEIETDARDRFAQLILHLAANVEGVEAVAAAIRERLNPL